MLNPIHIIRDAIFQFLLALVGRDLAAVEVDFVVENYAAIHGDQHHI